MRAFVYQAALYCEECGAAIRAKLAAENKAPVNPDDESSYNSDDYPKGPYEDGGGEADRPQHCDACGVFLENPLTDDGVEYVRERIAENPDWANMDGLVLNQWLRHYGENHPEIQRAAEMPPRPYWCKQPGRTLDAHYREKD